jgi:hypothetical protein
MTRDMAAVMAAALFGLLTIAATLLPWGVGAGVTLAAGVGGMAVSAVLAAKG